MTKWPKVTVLIVTLLAYCLVIPEVHGEAGYIYHPGIIEPVGFVFYIEGNVPLGKEP